MKSAFKFLEISLIITLCLSCQKKIEETTDIIARIDDQNITLEDFRLFYELDPNFGIDSTGYGALLDELHKFIDQKLSYRKAQQTGLMQDSLFVKAKNWEQKRAMLRQLYREKVEKQIEITEEELRQAFVRHNSELHVRQLFTKDAEHAQELYEQLQADATFETLASQVFADTVLAKNGGDLGWIKAGDLDEDFADATLSLGKNEISQPTQTQWGYHIIQLLDRKEQIILTESDFNAQKSGLEKRIKRKKGQRLSSAFIAGFMKDLNPQPVPNNFRLLWNAIVSPPEREKSTISFKITFTNKLINEILQTLHPYLDKPLIQYRGGSVTLGDYLIALKDIPVGNRPRFQSRKQLSNRIGIWIRDELLFEKALRKNLDNHPGVRAEVEDFLEQQSYLFFLSKEMEAINPPEWTTKYFENRDRNILRDHPELSGFHTFQEWVGYKAENNLHKTLKSINADIEIDYQTLLKESKNINWDRRVRMFAIRKPS